MRSNQLSYEPVPHKCTRSSRNGSSRSVDAVLETARLEQRDLAFVIADEPLSLEGAQPLVDALACRPDQGSQLGLFHAIGDDGPRGDGRDTP